MISSSRRRSSMTSRAWISMSVAWPWKPERDLVDQDLRVGQRHALALRPAGEQQRAHRHRDADADRRHVGLDEVHRVVDRQTRVHRPAGRVDVERDVLVGILGLQVQELGHDQVGDLIVHGRAEEDDPLVQAGGSRCRTHAPHGRSVRRPSVRVGSRSSLRFASNARILQMADGPCRTTRRED